MLALGGGKKQDDQEKQSACSYDEKK